MHLRQVVTATGQMPLDFPKSAALDMFARGLRPSRAIRSVIGTFPIRARLLELVSLLKSGFRIIAISPVLISSLT